MIVYTGSFAKWKNYPNPINIALNVPWWENKDAGDLLAPGIWFYTLKRQILLRPLDDIKAEYIDKYITHILNKSAKEIYDCIYDISHGQDCTLLCYEEPLKEKEPDIDKLVFGTTFCHRHLIAKYLREAGYESYEYILED